MPSQPGENRGERLGEFESKSEGFSPARELSQTFASVVTRLLRQGKKKIFFFHFYKIIIFHLNKDKDDTRFFHETVTSHNLEIEPTKTLIITTNNRLRKFAVHFQHLSQNSE